MGWLILVVDWLDLLYALSNSSPTSNLTGSIWNYMYGSSIPPIRNSWKLNVETVESWMFAIILLQFEWMNLKWKVETTFGLLYCKNGPLAQCPTGRNGRKNKEQVQLRRDIIMVASFGLVRLHLAPLKAKPNYISHIWFLHNNTPGRMCEKKNGNDWKAGLPHISEDCFIKTLVTGIWHILFMLYLQRQRYWECTRQFKFFFLLLIN